MRRNKQARDKLVTSFSSSRLQASVLRQNQVLLPKAQSSVQPSRPGKFGAASGQARPRNPVLRVMSLSDLYDCYEANKKRQDAAVAVQKQESIASTTTTASSFQSSTKQPLGEVN